MSVSLNFSGENAQECYYWVVVAYFPLIDQSCGEGACITQWSNEPRCAEPSKKMGHSEEFWQNVVHWRRKGQPTSVFLSGDPHGQYEKVKDKTLEDERSPFAWVRRCPICHWGRECITNVNRKNEASGPKQKWCSVVPVVVDENKTWCYKEKYCIGTWNVRTMNQGKLNMVEQETARLYINIFRNQWTKMDGNGQI